MNEILFVCSLKCVSPFILQSLLLLCCCFSSKMVRDTPLYFACRTPISFNPLIQLHFAINHFRSYSFASLLQSLRIAFLSSFKMRGKRKIMLTQTIDYFVSKSRTMSVHNNRNFIFKAEKNVFIFFSKRSDSCLYGEIKFEICLFSIFSRATFVTESPRWNKSENSNEMPIPWNIDTRTNTHARRTKSANWIMRWDFGFFFFVWIWQHYFWTLTTYT